LPSVLHKPTVRGGYYLRPPDLSAEMLVAPAERVVLSLPELERMRSEAMVQGRVQAEENLAAVREQAQSAASALLLLADSLAAEHRRVLENAAEEVVSLAYRIAEKILRRAVEQDPSAVIPLVRDLLQRSATHTSLTVRLSPPDHAFLKANLEPVPEAAAIEGLRLRPDPSVRPGGCVVETEAGRFDGLLETQLERIAEVLFPNREAAA